MTVAAVIPARGGSKGVPGKNLRAVGGRSLLARCIVAARRSGAVDVVLVSTDSDDIADEARRHGAEVVERPAAIAGDTASSEAALLHALEERADLFGSPVDVLVFLQCTSPFVDPARLADAVGAVRDGTCDVSFAVVESHGFLWTETDEGMRGINHHHSERLRRQDRPRERLETGAFYVMRAAGFAEHRHRFFGRIEAAVVDPLHAIEIDTPADLALARRAAPIVDPLGVAAIDPASVDALVMDFDGVHTDNTAIVTQDGVESARVSRLDGMGVSIARRAGLAMLILSTETNPIVQRRAEKLQVDCISDCDDKLTALRGWTGERGLDPARVAYIGNDVNDRECLDWVGCPIIVSDAHHSLFDTRAIVTTARGGEGAVREVTDQLVTPHHHADPAAGGERP
ncbi:cytidylyltransferase domain-containing protein [Ilumatobacter sp.]|uniref:cytidylyltransferase domain-containing protein n=1 Tax=Ilumatobacter sp. TaxID=1967498 RepID=UPI003B51D1CC